MRIIMKGEVPKQAKLQMTSMIDVVFLLIIFFMLVTEFTKMEAEDLQLPKATAAVDDEPVPRHRVIVNVKKEGLVVVFRKPYSRAELGKMLSRLSRLNSNSDGLSQIPVKIRADAHVRYGHVQQVMVECMKAKIWQISFGCTNTETTPTLNAVTN